MKDNITEQNATQQSATKSGREENILLIKSHNVVKCTFEYNSCILMYVV